MATPGDLALRAIEAALTAHQRGLLEGMAVQAQLPATGWTAAGPLLTMAESMAVVTLAQEIQRERPGRGWSWCLDAAEHALRGDAVDDLEALPHSVRARLAAWRRNVRP